MNNNLLKHISEFIKTFEKDHTFYIDGERTNICKADDIGIAWDMRYDWSFLYEPEINAVIIKGASLTILAKNGREYTFIAKPESKKEEVTEKIVSLLKPKLTRIFYNAGIKEEIDEIIYLLDELERINKEQN